MSKNKLLIIILFLTVMLTGCFPSGESKQSSTPETSAANNTGTPDSSDGGGVSEPAAFAVPNDLEHVRFEVELPDSYPTELPIIKAKKHKFDEEEQEKIISILCGDKEIKTGDYGELYTDDGEELIFRDTGFSYHLIHRYTGNDEKQLIYDIQNTAAHEATGYYMQYPNINSELEGFPRSEAKQRADELIEKLGIKYLGEPTIYTFTSEDVKVNLQGQITTDGKEGGDPIDISLPKEEQFYLLRYVTTYNDIPAIYGSGINVFGDVYQASSYVDIMLTKNELVDLVCNGVYDELEVEGSTKINCSAEDVLSKLYDYYSFKDTGMKYRLEYYGLDFAYVTYEENYNTGEFVYKPLWRATGQYISLDDPTSRRHDDKFIDPATGLVFDAGD